MPTLSEAESARRLSEAGVPVAPSEVVSSGEEAAAAAERLGFPVVAKLCGDSIAHKTERGLVRLKLADGDAVRAAADELLGMATPDDGDVAVLVAPMISGNRELIAGLHRDEQFGMTVMLGVGGILAEAVQDVAFRLVPLDRVDAEDLLDDLRTQELLGAFRGEAAADREALVGLLLGLAAYAESEPALVSADLNPVIIGADGTPVAVDALVEVSA